MKKWLGNCPFQTLRQSFREIWSFFCFTLSVKNPRLLKHYMKTIMLITYFSTPSFKLSLCNSSNISISASGRSCNAISSKSNTFIPDAEADESWASLLSAAILTLSKSETSRWFKFAIRIQVQTYKPLTISPNTI